MPRQGTSGSFATILLVVTIIAAAFIGALYIETSANPKTNQYITSTSPSSSTSTSSTTTYTTTPTTSTSTSTVSTGGQPLVEITNTNLPSSIPATGGSNISISCQKPNSGTYGEIVVANQGTGSASLKLVVMQYSALSSMGGYATAYLTGKSCSFLPAGSTTTLYVAGLPTAAQTGSYYDGWAVLTSGAETNVFSGQFT